MSEKLTIKECWYQCCGVVHLLLVYLQVEPEPPLGVALDSALKGQLGLRPFTLTVPFVRNEASRFDCVLVPENLCALLDLKARAAKHKKRRHGASGQSKLTSEEKKFACRVCDKRWPTSSALKSHMIHHTGETLSKRYRYR